MSRKIGNPGLKPITVLLRQLQSAMRQSIEEALREDDLTISQANVLTELAYGPARSNAELARIHFVTPQTMVEILMSLERRGLMVRTPQPEGGRAMLAELTKEGTRKVFAVHLAMRQVEERLLSALSRENVSRLRRLLEDCLVALAKDEPGA
ncbi:MAG: MarR family transcriptional regulator [Bryobacteraceae bacterium]